MLSTLATLSFVLFMTLVVPLLIGLLIWRTIRRALKNAGIPANALEVSKLRDLIAQARVHQAQVHQAPARGVAMVTPSGARAPQPPAILVKSLGHGIGIIAIVFSGIGLISGTVATLMAWSQYNFLSDVVRAEGQVVRNVKRGGNKSSYHPIVRFQPPESDAPLEFEAPIGNTPPQFAVGEAVTVLYPPGKPGDAKVDNWLQLWFGPMLSGFFLLVFGGLGVGFLIPSLLQRGRAAWARENGTQTQARFSGAAIDRTTKVNGRSPYKVYADWKNPVDGKTYRFQSQKALWFDPTTQLTQRPDIPLRVDPQQPRRYWLDLSHLKSS